MPTRILVVDDSPTIRKVVSAILERHGFEATSAADGQHALDALSDGEKIDLVLLDFVMPRMNGYQFCRALRGGDARLRALPVVLMSAKTDKIREQFVQQTGAVDAITKPFDAQALVAVIENALKRVVDGSTRASSSVGFDEAEPPSLRRPEDSARIARRELELAARLAKIVAPVLKAVPSAAWGDEGQIASALSNKLPPDALRDLGLTLRDFDFGDRSPIALSGDLAALPIGAVLQMLQVERQTGLLAVLRLATPETPGSEVTITWRSGLVDLVQSRGAGDEFRLGRFFMEEGLVTPKEIDALLHRRASEPPRSARAAQASPPSRPRLIGDLLIEAGRISEENLKAALVRQASELIYEVLRWQKGRFEFRVQPVSTLAERAKLSLPVASMVMEGFRRVDEWRIVEQAIGSFESVLVRDPMAISAAGAGSLERGERSVLEAIDGERTVREVIAESHLSSFDACRILSQLVEARLVRRKHETAPPAPSVPSAPSGVDVHRGKS